MSVLANRHDIMVLFDVTNGNPNGDPDAGNLPRIDPTTNKGLVSDVCLKRKIRNYIIDFHTKSDGTLDAGKDILVRQGTVIGSKISGAIKEITGRLDKKANDRQKAEAAMKLLCETFYDIRIWGCACSG